MTIFKSGSEEQFLFTIADIELGVLDFNAQEELSSPFFVSLTIVSEDEINFDDVIGQEALLTLLGDEDDRYFHGIISEFMHAGSKDRFYLYRTRMVPSIWLLSFEQDCRIFQNENVPDIVKKILEDRQMTSNTFEFRLQKQYPPREYCVQYRETDLNFISRLLEEEGIFYFFEHAEDQHTLVFGDSTVNYQPIEGEAAVVFNPSDDMVPEEECVYSYSLSRQIQTGKVTLQDFNFERPSLNLTTQKEADSFSELERYDYPGEYFDQSRGKNLAEVRLQETVMFKDYAEGQSVCLRFLPAFTFELTDHDLDDFNREYLLVEVNHTGSQPQTLEERAGSEAYSSYSNQFTAVPSSVAARPPRKTPKPIMEGVQTAIVVGPSGEEIYTDEHGRVKVQFHWDREGQRDENSSCWIRVSQVSAGAGWGALDVPRIGHEVIVDFIEGDPDRPIITGRVYHGTNTPPFDPAAGGMVSGMKSNSTPGGGGYNEMSMNDTKGKEGITIHAQKNHTSTVQNDRTTTIVSGKDTLTVQAGTRSQTIKGDTSLTVQAGKRTVTVTGGDYSAISTDHAVKIHGKGSGVTIKGDSNGVVIGGTGQGVSIDGKGGTGVEIAGNPDFVATSESEARIWSNNVIVHGDTSVTIVVGGSTIEVTSSGVKVNAAKVELNC